MLYITTTVVIVIYEVSGGTFAATTVPPPPKAGWIDDPTPTKNFLFFSKTRWWRVSKKTKLFLFIYFSFYNIYII